MDDGDSKHDPRATAERAVAAALAGLWTAIAIDVFGVKHGVGVAMLFLLALAMIGAPGLMASLRSHGIHRNSGAEGTISPALMEFVGWSLMLGLPAAWFPFSRTFAT